MFGYWYFGWICPGFPMQEDFKLAVRRAASKVRNLWRQSPKRLARARSIKGASFASDEVIE